MNENNDDREVGEYMFANGDVLRGKFRKAKCKGQAILNYANGDRFEGRFFPSEPNVPDKGTIYYKNGDVYEGFFTNGVPRGGEGKLKLVNGDVYEGDISYKDGKFEFDDVIKFIS